MLSCVAVYSKEGNVKTTEVVSLLVDEFRKRGIEILVYQKSTEWKVCSKGRDESTITRLENLKKRPEIVLSVGGDGTFLETVLNVMDAGIPVAGVNTGRMGFLANISVEEISNAIDMLCRGEYDIIERSLLEIVSPGWLFSDSSRMALNEITLQKADPRMITINVYVGNVHLNTYWADGLIISTATGSTAYNLSVGGPILSPEDRSIIISPISPHNLTIRPIILSGDSTLKMIVEGRTKEYLATCDFRSERVLFSEEIHIRRSAETLKTVMLKGRDFYSTLRNKLMWGADKRN